MRPINTFTNNTPADADEVNANFAEVWAVPNIYTATAGETINGGTLPVPVYIDESDGEVYACDADDSTKLNFSGFAVTDGTDGNDIDVQTSGVVLGFSSLSVGENYFVSDTVGVISTSRGENSVFVGVAVSATEIEMVHVGDYAPMLLLDNTTEDSGNITVKTLIKTITIPAGTLTANNAVRITAAGEGITSIGSPQITCEVGGTEVANTGAFGNNGSGSWVMTITLVGDGDTSSQKYGSHIGADSSSNGDIALGQYATLSKDATSDIDVEFYGNSLDSDNAICTVGFVLIEKIN